MITSAGMGHEIPEKELIRVSAHTLKTYRQNQKEVNTTFGTHIYFYSCEGKVAQDVTNDLARMLRVRFRQNAPRRPPKVILVGPPGSGRTTQAQMIASQFGLVCVSPAGLVREEQIKNPVIKKCVAESLAATGEIPDDIIMRQVDERLKQSDCRVNGWILDGFPQTDAQMQMLKAAKIVPTCVCMMEQQIDDSIRRLKNRRIDPITGQIFNTDIHHKIP